MVVAFHVVHGTFVFRAALHAQSGPVQPLQAADQAEFESAPAEFVSQDLDSEIVGMVGLQALHVVARLFAILDNPDIASPTLLPLPPLVIRQTRNVVRRVLRLGSALMSSNSSSVQETFASDTCGRVAVRAPHVQAIGKAVGVGIKEARTSQCHHASCVVAVDPVGCRCGVFDDAIGVSL